MVLVVLADRAEVVSKLVCTLEQTGFVAHPAKSQWTQSFQVLWLMFDINLCNGANLVLKVSVEAIKV